MRHPQYVEMQAALSGERFEELRDNKQRNQAQSTRTRGNSRGPKHAFDCEGSSGRWPAGANRRSGSKRRECALRVSGMEGINAKQGGSRGWRTEGGVARGVCDVAERGIRGIGGGKSSLRYALRL